MRSNTPSTYASFIFAILSVGGGHADCHGESTADSGTDAGGTSALVGHGSWGCGVGHEHGAHVGQGDWVGHVQGGATGQLQVTLVTFATQSVLPLTGATTVVGIEVVVDEEGQREQSGTDGPAKSPPPGLDNSMAGSDTNRARQVNTAHMPVTAVSGLSSSSPSRKLSTRRLSTGVPMVRDTRSDAGMTGNREPRSSLQNRGPVSGSIPV